MDDNDQAQSLKFLTDTHIAKAVSIQLRARGVDIIRCEEVGLANAKDVVLLEYAIQTDRVLVSIDQDVLRLHHHYMSNGKDHTGIVRIASYLQGQDGIGRIVTELYTYYELIRDGAGTVGDDFHNQIIFVG